VRLYLPLTFDSPLPPPLPGEVAERLALSAVEGSETRYRPYGEVRAAGAPVAGLTGRTFTGQAWDEGTGLLYYALR
jgi:hypothetical protein